METSLLEKNSEERNKAIALLKHLGREALDYDSDDSGETWESGNVQYMILDDSEADDRWDEYLDSYIDECMEIPEHVMPYFDREAWKKDAEMDGRGHCLSSYDRCEHEIEIGNGNTYYIYRIN